MAVAVAAESISSPARKKILRVVFISLLLDLVGLLMGTHLYDLP
jgi:hypothetical protein